MYVIDCNPGEPVASEEMLLDCVYDLKGVLLHSVMVPNGNATKEIDAILINPAGVIPVEAKGVSGSGLLRPALNGPWMFGGAPASFAGGNMPHVQARQAAQVLGSHIRTHVISTEHRVRGLCFVTGRSFSDVTLEDGVVDLGDVLVTNPLWCHWGVVEAASLTLNLRGVEALLSSLGVTPPEHEVLLREGFTGSAPRFAQTRRERRPRPREMHEVAPRRLRHKDAGLILELLEKYEVRKPLPPAARASVLGCLDGGRYDLALADLVETFMSAFTMLDHEDWMRLRDRALDTSNPGAFYYLMGVMCDTNVPADASRPT